MTASEESTKSEDEESKDIKSKIASLKSSLNEGDKDSKHHAQVSSKAKAESETSSQSEAESEEEEGNEADEGEEE